MNPVCHDNFPTECRSDSPRTITWLHLSDLHACKPKTGWDAHRVIGPLRGDLQRMQEGYHLHPDLIFFTGDAGFGQIGEGKGETLREQFDDAHYFLEQIRRTFDQPVPQSNVFIVPGNHDVDRREVTQDQIDWLERQHSSSVVTKLIHEAGRQWSRYMERLGPYKTFLEQRGYNHLLGSGDRLIYAQKREISGVEVGIAGFNSAWACCRDHEKGKLWFCGDWQAGELTSQLRDVAFSIALVHHPFNWFVEQEDPSLLRLIEREFAFHLHGHEHQGWVDEKSDGHTRIAAGACYQGADQENGYNFVRLDLETGVGQVWLRQFDSHGRDWVQRIVAHKTDCHGMWPLHHSVWVRGLLAGSAVARSDSVVEANLARRTALKNVPTGLEFGSETNPVIWPDSVDFRPDMADRLEAEWPAIVKLLAGHARKRILFLEGDSGFGKSVLLRQAGTYAKKLAIPVVRVDLKNGGVEVAAILGKFGLEVGSLLPNFLRAGARETLLLRKDLRALRKPLLIMFDSFEDAANNNSVADWLGQQLLEEVETALGVAVIVAGQKVPNSTDAYWGDLVQRLPIGPITEVDEWRPWIERRYPSFRHKNADLPTVLMITRGKPAVITAACEAIANS
jgi:predicted MPP superfamily phosphohydrolase